MVRLNAKSAASPDTLNTNGSLFLPRRLTTGLSTVVSISVPGAAMGLEPVAWSEPRVIQQVDINEVPLSIQEHRGHPAWCSCCRKLYEAPLPIGIERGGLVGPKLTTLIAYLKGVCHASFSTIRKFIRDVVRSTISRGQLSRIIGKVTRARGAAL